MSIVLKPKEPRLRFLSLTLDAGIESSQSYEAKVTGIIDGDTLEVDLAPIGPIQFRDAQSIATVESTRLIQHLRLLGIDAPETKAGDHANHQCAYLGIDINLLLQLAKISTIHLQSLCLKGAKISLTTTGKVKDDYERILAGVYAGDLCVNKAMVEHGYAMAYQGHSDWEDYGEAEASAKEARRGIWGNCEESYYPASASSKTYHRPGCGSAPRAGTRFSSVKEAKAKGFKPCLACIPDFRRV